MIDAYYFGLLLGDILKKYTTDKENPMPGIPAPVSPLGRAPVIAVETPRLHPLHTVEFLTAQMYNTGRYPDMDRCTGRTTILALSYIVKALESPHTPITVSDHHPTRSSHTALLSLMQHYVDVLGLRHMKFNHANLTVQFTTVP